MINIGNSGVKNKPFIVLESCYIGLPNGDEMYVPAGYTFDNGSILKITKWLYDTFGWEFLNYKYTAFLVHDYVYNYRGYHTSPELLLKPVTRATADGFMKYFMRLHGDTEFKVKIWFFFVRLLGWMFFGKM